MKACNVRNYVMAELVLGNATRCSNIIEFRVEDFHTAYPSELPNAMEIFSKRYKTSIIYGKKIIHFKELQVYRDLIRPHLCKEYYVVRYAQLEAARISHKCYDRFHIVKPQDIVFQENSQPKPAPTHQLL